MPVSRLALTDFRSYPSALIEPGPGFVLLFGENGAGKTNLLEAVSLLTPGRGLRGAALSEMARHGGSGSFAVAARVGETEIGTGTLATAPERRQVRINGAPASVNSLSEWQSVLWLTPAMDRLFLGSAGDRRRFLDRLVMALEPSHAHHRSRYEAAMRARNKLLAEESPDRPGSPRSSSDGRARHRDRARARADVAELDDRLDDSPEDEFARARSPARRLGAGGPRRGASRQSPPRCRRRTRDRGPHRQDLAVSHRAKADGRGAIVDRRAEGAAARASSSLMPSW